MMSTLNISYAVLSISSPGTYLNAGDDSSARQLTRQCNEFAAGMCKRHPSKFGFWASLPLPDVEGSLLEIAHALDNLGATGFALHTNHDGIYPGDPKFDPVFKELNKRNARLFIHPTTPCVAGCGGHDVVEALPTPQFPQPMFEFLFDTARCIINLFLSGTISRFPNIQYIIPHAGGTFPGLIDRFTAIAKHTLPAPYTNVTATLDGDKVKEVLNKRFWFDLAGFPFPDQIHALLRAVGQDRLLYGSDFPFTPFLGCVKLAIDMEGGLKEIFPDESVREGVFVGNARRMLGEKTDGTKRGSKSGSRM